MSRSNIHMKATVEIALDDFNEFLSKGKDVFPLLAKELGWELSSTWEQKSNRPTVVIYNLWKTDEVSIEGVYEKFESAQFNLEANVVGFKDNAKYLDGVIGINEDFTFTSEFTF